LKRVFAGIILLVIATTQMSAQSKTKKYNKLDIKMFPKAAAGQKQYYIQVPIEPNEDELKPKLCNTNPRIG
jgi:ecotin